jgi:glycosyltransferase involved in cell wall biosynthesis
MKILFISPGHPVYDIYPDGGGTQSQIFGISKEFVKLGYEVYILKRFIEKKTENLEGINFVDIKAPFKDDVLSVLLYSKNTIKEIKKIKPDIINLSERFSAYFPSKLDISQVFFTANYDAFDYYRDFALKYNKLNYFFFDLKRRLEENIMKNSDVVIALNKSIEGYLSSRGIENTVVVPRGVDPKLYSNRGDKEYILYAGRLNKVKGIDILIKAFDSLNDDFNNYHLILMGSGPDENRLRRLALKTRKKDKIKFIPWSNRDILQRYLSECSVFVLPSLFETFGVVLLEAMASSKPVIASDIIGPKDVITHGKDGFLFEKGNIKDLIKCLELCLSDRKKRNLVGKNAKKLVEEKYVFNKIALRLANIFKEIL